MKFLILFLAFYLSISIYSAERIKVQDKCGTFHTSTKETKTNKTQELEFDLNRQTLDSVCNSSYSSPSGKFLIHYAIKIDKPTSLFDTIRNNHTVSNVDKENNGIPDYVDSIAFYFDYAYQKEVLEMGYRSPVQDSGQSGSTQYDIYLIDLGTTEGYYGLTYPDKRIFDGNNKVVKYQSFIVMDNNYSESDSIPSDSDPKKMIKTYNESPWMCVKITAAHEFHHAIQFVYWYQISNRNFPEMTSTCFENRLFPESKDIFTNQKLLMYYPFSVSPVSLSSDEGYATGVFGLYLSNQYGDEILKKSWEKIGEGIDLLLAFDSALVEVTGKHLDSHWCDFMPWLYHTGRKAIKGKYFYNAEFMPELKYENLLDTTNSIIFEGPLEVCNFNISPFTFSTYRKIFVKPGTITDDTLDILIPNIDLEKALKHIDIGIETTLSLTTNPTPNYNNIENKYYYNLSTANNLCPQIFLGKGIESDCISYSFPEPFITNQHDDLTLNVSCNAKPYNYKKAVVKLLNIDMTPFYTKEIQVSIENGNKIVRLNDIRQHLATGTYIYMVDFDDQQFMGKFSVR